jgi:2,5-diketo-D-gluconate reductase A
MTTVPTVRLNNGVDIPQLGFGVFQVPPEDTRDVTLRAFAVGYRHIDTAQMYRNERGVGQALADSGLDRDEVFITSKLNNTFHDAAAAKQAFEQSLEALGIDRLDLFLIHWPLPAVGRYVEVWEALEEQYRAGLVRAIGVSNFHQHHLQRLFDQTEIVPAVNQIEVSPYLVQDPLRAFCRDHGIAVEAWSPIARGKVVGDPVIEGIAAEVGRSAAQVTLRWHVQRGDIVFPKSLRPERMAENFAIFDFALDEDQMAALTALDAGLRTGPNPDEFNWTGR